MKRLICLTLVSFAGVVLADGDINTKNGVHAGYGDFTAAKLSEGWWRWLSASGGRYAEEEGLVDCSAGQFHNPKIWFLAGTTGNGPVSRECSIPAGHTLFFPNVTVSAHNVAGENFTVPQKRLIAEEFFLELPPAGDGNGVQGFRSCGIMTTINGLPSTSAGFDIVRAQSDPFATPLDPSVTDPERISDGYWNMISLPAGDHTVRIQGGVCSRVSGSYIFEVDVTYRLHVS